MASTYRDYLLELAPPWLARTKGAPFMHAIGDVKDALVWRLKESVRARLVRYASDDELGAIGFERQIPRSLDTETTAAYAARLRAAWDTWLYAGTAKGLLTALFDSGFPSASVAIYNRRRFYLSSSKALQTMTLASHSWLFGATTETNWARFIVLIPQPLPTRWGGVIPASDSDEANLVRELIRRWKPAHMRCTSIAIATSTETWDYFPAGGTWDTTGGTWDDQTQWTIWSA